MRRLATFILLAGLAALPFRMATAAPAQDLIQRLADEAITVLGDASLSGQQRQDGLRPLFTKYLDLPFIGRFVLGRHWRPLDEQQRSAYTSAFSNYVATIYARRLEDYSGETMKVVGSQSLSDTDTMVNTQLIRPNGPPVAVDWRVRMKGDTGNVIDVVVEGVSMVVTQRDEFNAYLQQRSVETLIERLKAGAPELAPPPARS